VADESVRRAFLSAIEAAHWEHELPRLVYADWLDENGEHEEADRQRRYVPAERWLRELAGQLNDETCEPMSYETLIGTATDYLQTGSHYSLFLGDLDEVNKQMGEFWKSFKIVTGVAAPDSARERMFFVCHC